MPVDFSLPDLPRPRFSEVVFRGPLTAVREISRRNRARLENGNETRQFKNRKEELIRRLQRRGTTGESFDRATAVLGRERLLLTLYQEYFGREDGRNWLPAFDDRIARSLLEDTGASWHSGRRRQVTLLFFTHFDRLDALSFICNRLIEAHSSAENGGTEQARRWREQRKVIFNITGPEAIAKQTRVGERLPELMERFAIPSRGRFSEKLRQVVLLRAIEVAPMGEVTDAFTEIESLREERVSGDKLMGAAALEIMVKRVAVEGGRRWTGHWPRWLTRFGCDPRYGRATGESAKWWGWATDSELRLAQQGITGLTLEFFIGFLQSSLRGTEREAQFSLRSRFLLALFEAQRIQNARLVLNRSAHQQFPHQHRDPWNVALLHGRTDQTSMVCLQCTDDIYIIEGTHSFGLRMFHRRFPVDGFWEHPSRTYHDRDLRISPGDCPVFLRHSPSGSWVHKFFHELRARFHIEWHDVRMRLP